MKEYGDDRARVGVNGSDEASACASVDRLGDISTDAGAFSCCRDKASGTCCCFCGSVPYFGISTILLLLVRRNNGRDALRRVDRDGPADGTSSSSSSVLAAVGSASEGSAEEVVVPRE